MLITILILQLLLLGAVFFLFFRASGRGLAEMLEQQARQGREELRNTLEQQARQGREELRSAFSDFMKLQMDLRTAVSQAEKESLTQQTAALQNYGDRMDERLSRLSSALEENITRLQNAMQEENRNSRKEQLEFQTRFQEGMRTELAAGRNAVDERLKAIQQESAVKLEEMKKTVDEKLQSSMEKHFNESFKIISERLEQVHKGLGEMQTLAAGVGDLRKVLTNVKTRGNIGEIQLAAILEQYLAPDQYVANVSTVPDSRELVEFAIRMPGPDDGTPVLLPVDSKFPVEDYQRLIECLENNPRMSQEVRKAQESFARTVRKCAQDIHEKYIYPPHTTAFGIMFVPSEGIYAEILHLTGLFEELQNKFKITVVGPTNLAAFLNSLQLGFRTLAIQKRSSEVWNILGAVKSEFSKFGDEMDAARKSLQSVVNHVEKIGTRSRALERRLRDVQTLPEAESRKLLDSPEPEKKDTRSLFSDE